VVVRAVVDPHELEVLVHRGAEVLVESLGVEKHLLEERLDLVGVAVGLVVGDPIAGDGGAVEVVAKQALLAREPLETRRLDAEDEDLVAVGAEALELSHPTRRRPVRWWFHPIFLRLAGSANGPLYTTPAGFATIGRHADEKAYERRG